MLVTPSKNPLRSKSQNCLPPAPKTRLARLEGSDIVTHVTPHLPSMVLAAVKAAVGEPSTSSASVTVPRSTHQAVEFKDEGPHSRSLVEDRGEAGRLACDQLLPLLPELLKSVLRENPELAARLEDRRDLPRPLSLWMTFRFDSKCDAVMTLGVRETANPEILKRKLRAIASAK